MGDEFDGCECIFSHELAIRQLLSLLRHGQSYCTDTECIDLPGTPSRNGENGNFMLMSMFMIFAVILYVLRPNTMRRNIPEIQKPNQSSPSNGRDDDSNNGTPPPAVG